MSASLLKICALVYFTQSGVMPGALNPPQGKVAISEDKGNCMKSDVYDDRDCLCNGQVCCIGSGKAKSKCEEYGQFAYAEDYGAALMTRRTLQNISQCHIEVVPLVVGGMEAKLMEFPHMTAIGFGDKPDVKYICGGSLISKQHILTAAHCSKSHEHGIAKWAKLGATNLQESDEFVQEYLIIDRILHPRYTPPSRYNDIAIFKLDKPAEMTAYVRPACLHTEPEISVTRATATGWGQLSYADTKGSHNLMKVELSIIRGPACEDTYKTDVGGVALNQGVIASQFCAGELAGGKDTCQGDSGGPLQTVLASPFCMYSVVGVTSFGKFCAFANAPAVYTRVSHYVPWIESILWP